MAQSANRSEGAYRESGLVLSPDSDSNFASLKRQSCHESDLPTIILADGSGGPKLKCKRKGASWCAIQILAARWQLT